MTGASRGIGLATARLFCAAGWDTVSVSRTRPGGDAPRGLRHVGIDLLQRGWAGELASWLAAELGAERRQQLCIVHNAAQMPKDSALALSAQTLRDSLELNVVAPAEMNRLLYPRMGAGSSVLYVGSTLSGAALAPPATAAGVGLSVPRRAAEKAVANTASYVTAKHAMVGLMRSTCQDLAAAKAPVHTACICPGFTDTEMLREHVPETAGLAGLVGAGRLIEPEEVGKLLLFSAENPVINGAVLHANLGQIEG